MKDHIVSTQYEYDRAIEHIAILRNRPFYDIEWNRGTEIVGEVDSLMYRYLYDDMDKESVYDGLSDFHFDQSQADEIIRHFQEHPPRDMFDIERALNRLHIIPHDYEEDKPEEYPKIIIKDAREKITVRSDVEVCGNSFVEAFGHSCITVKNNAYIIARDKVSVEAHHKTRVDAHDHARIKAFNNALVTATGESQVKAYHKSSVIAGEKVNVSAYHNVYVKSIQEAETAAFDKAVVDAWGNSKVNAFHNSHIIAWDTSTVRAHDRSFIQALDSSKVEACDQSCVLARKNALVIGADNSLILTCDNARSITSGNSSSIDEKENTAKNLRENILTVMRRPRYGKDPILAVQLLLLAVTKENTTAISNKLFDIGCTDAAKTKNILARWVKTREEDISYER